MDEGTLSIEQRLKNEIGSIDWAGLERHFARGVLIRVDPSLNLLEVAAIVVEDDATSVAVLMESGKMRHVTADDAIPWQQNNTMFHALVAAPWVLVQPLA